MDENNQDGSEVLETTEEDVVTDTVEPSGDDADDVEALKAKNAQLFARAKKAEGFVQDKNGNWVKPEPKKSEDKPDPSKEETLSNKDVFLLTKANVELEDVDEVTRYAKFNNLTIAQALEDKTLKTILADRVEERRSAQVAQTKGARGTSKATPEAIVKAASEGKLPESDAGIAELAEARMAGKLPK